ncbi:hypothetical protein [Streptomyces mesophilus]|uniref:hypothetical protein n=1 Tax=Streptomyces mesophilus TaxID=1775132 RepID=UPI003319ECFD
MSRVRNVLGSVLALAGAAAVVWSPFRAWYDGRLGRDYRIDELFSADGVTDDKAQLFGSLFLPFLFVAMVTLVGVVVRSRLLLAFAGIVAMGFAVLWMVRVGQAEGSLSVDADGNGLDVGAGSAFVGGAMILLAALIMSGRPRRAAPAPAAPASTVPTLDGPDPHAPDSFDAFDDRSSSSPPPAASPPPPMPPVDGPPPEQQDGPPPAWHKPPPSSGSGSGG